jgi:hypothetical protein
VDLSVADARPPTRGLSDLVLGPSPRDGAEPRTQRTRRALLDQVGWSLGLATGVPQSGPMIVAWTSGPDLAVHLGTAAKEVGDTLLVYPATIDIAGPTAFPTGLLARSVLAATANEAADQGGTLNLGRGTMTVEVRPAGFGGPFQVEGLSLAMTQGEPLAVTGRGPSIEPLPADQQPPQDDPVGTTVARIADGLGEVVGGDDAGGVAIDPVAPDGAAPDEVPAWDGIPDIQLFDRMTERWMELPHLVARREVRIADPGRYVNESGAFLVRFVNRGDQGMITWFTPMWRLEGVAG